MLELNRKRAGHEEWHPILFQYETFIETPSFSVSSNTQFALHCELSVIIFLHFQFNFSIKNKCSVKLILETILKKYNYH